MITGAFGLSGAESQLAAKGFVEDGGQEDTDPDLPISSTAIPRYNHPSVDKNQLYYGDNLTVLREHIRDESVDLIYLDPPFNSRQDYNVLFAEKSGERSASQIMAFEHTWEWRMDAERSSADGSLTSSGRARNGRLLAKMERLLRMQLRGGKFSNVSPERSSVMGKIRSKGNRTTELSFRLALVRAGIRGWLLHPKEVFGTPDFYFPSKKVAVFVDGCFWHGCPRCGHVPRTRSAFWRTKIERNRQRAKLVSRRLRRVGVRVLRIWEHDLQNRRTLARLEGILKE